MRCNRTCNEQHNGQSHNNRANNGQRVKPPADRLSRANSGNCNGCWQVNHGAINQYPLCKAQKCRWAAKHSFIQHAGDAKQQSNLKW